MKLSPGDLNPGLCPPHPTPHKHLYLWSDYRTKGVRWSGGKLLKTLNSAFSMK